MSCVIIVVLLLLAVVGTRRLTRQDNSSGLYREDAESDSNSETG